MSDDGILCPAQGCNTVGKTEHGMHKHWSARHSGPNPFIIGERRPSKPRDPNAPPAPRPGRVSVQNPRAGGKLFLGVRYEDLDLILLRQTCHNAGVPAGGDRKALVNRLVEENIMDIPDGMPGPDDLQDLFKFA